MNDNPNDAPNRFKIFAGKGQTWLGLIGAIGAIWLPLLLADPIPTNRKEWLARISGTIFVAIAAVGRSLGAAPDESATNKGNNP